MRRNIERLQQVEYDLLVIGGGIYGAFVAWDSALRGLSVALVESKDFGQATSANSLKIIHGGLRYLKELNPRRARLMLREQRIWMKIASHQIKPLPFILPTDRAPSRSRTLLKAALTVSQMIGYTLGDSKGKPKLPASRLLNARTCRQYVPDLPADATGAALWYDCQIRNSERLLLSVLQSAARKGATIANYVEVAAILRPGSRVTGVKARDLLTGRDLTIRAKCAVNCAGPWVGCLLESLGASALPRQLCWSSAVNLVTKNLNRDYALALPDKTEEPTRVWGSSPLLFVVPWRSFSIIGTLHRPAPEGPSPRRIVESEVRHLLERVNQSFPGANLRRSDVLQVHRGYLPSLANPHQKTQVKLLREGRIVDHERDEGIQGLISLVGVKYTAARIMAEKAVDLVIRKLGRKRIPCQTDRIPLEGGDMEEFDSYLEMVLASAPAGVESTFLSRLVTSYGSKYRQVLDQVLEECPLVESLGSSAPISAAEVIWGAREEMAQTLEDIVRRRTELYLESTLDEDILRACARLLAREHGWDDSKTEAQIRQMVPDSSSDFPG